MSRSLARQLVRLALGLAIFAAAPAARADTRCPDAAPEDPGERRQLAKEWFSKAEVAEGVGDDLAAVRAYGCSMKMVPHAFTAYNLGRIAERAGDLELALGSFKSYLTLKPDAADQKEVEARIAKLEERIAAVRQQTTEETPAPEPPVPAPIPRVEQRAVAREGADEDSRFRMGVAEWVVAGAGTAALVAGVVFNVAARRSMSDCRDLAGSNLRAAKDACDTARPFAYTSYILLGAAAAAAVTEVVLIVTRSSPDDDDSRVGIMPLPGGMGLAFSRKY